MSDEHDTCDCATKMADLTLDFLSGLPPEELEARLQAFETAVRALAVPVKKTLNREE